MDNGIAGRIATLRDDIAEAIAVARPSTGSAAGVSVELVAVSKKQPDERIDAALAAGQRVFGENRVQEAVARWGGRDREGIQLRFIGPLQTNKVAEAVALFDVIETIDREKLARAVAKEIAADGARTTECLVQVNIGMEDQKSGIAPDAAVDFAAMCRDELGLNITGFMCIPPASEEPAMHFALLAKLAGLADLRVLSMGMSGDYREAIAFGATHVRIGTALFGERIP